jgi:hypothetical protein
MRNFSFCEAVKIETNEYTKLGIADGMPLVLIVDPSLTFASARLWIKLLKRKKLAKQKSTRNT